MSKDEDELVRLALNSGSSEIVRGATGKGGGYSSVIVGNPEFPDDLINMDGAKIITIEGPITFRKS